jgi:hypothetical protein
MFRTEPFEALGRGLSLFGLSQGFSRTLGIVRASLKIRHHTVSVIALLFIPSSLDSFEFNSLPRKMSSSPPYW